MYQRTSRQLAVTIAVALLLTSGAAQAARPKSGRLAAMALPGGPIASLITGSADPDRVWATNDAATFWRSDDAGEHWTRLGDHAATRRLLLPSPHDRDVLYALDLEAAHLYRSTDAGASFSRVDDGSLTSNGYSLSSLAADPFAPANLYAGGVSGIWRSTNGGVTWAHLSAQPQITYFPSARAIVPDPARRGLLWARSFVEPTRPLWRSSDGGVSWTAVPTPFEAAPFPGYQPPGATLIADPGTTGRLILTGLLAGNSEPDRRQDHVFETLDDGATWRDLGAPAAGFEVNGLVLEGGTGGAVWARVDADAHQRSHLYRLAPGATGWSEAPDPHGQRITDLASLPGSDSQLLVTTLGGVRRWVGAAWRRPQVEPMSQAVTKIATAGNGPPWVFVGTAADGLWRGLVSASSTPPATASWEQVSPRPDSGADRVTALAVQTSAAPARVYVALRCTGIDRCLDGFASRIYRSDCDGCLWQTADGGLPATRGDITGLAVDPTDSDTVWATVRWDDTGGVWRSRDGGRSWQVEWRGLDSGGGVFDVKVAPDDPDRVFANVYYRTTYCWQPGDARWERCFERNFGILSAFAAGPNGLALAAVRGEGSFLSGEAFERSLDGGASWQPVVAEPVGYLSAINAIATTRDAPGEVWIANSSYSDLIRVGLWRSRDRGEHFELAVEKGGITSLTTLPDDRGVVFVGTDHGLYRWIDTCVPDADTLCLDGGRMRVEGSWQNRYDGSAGRVRVRQQSDATGVLAFSDLANPELIVKAIDLGRPRPEIFVGQLTDLDWQVRITDTKTGERQVITNHDGACKPPEREVGSTATEACIADARTLCLLGGALRVRATWDNQYDGSHGSAGTLPYSPLASWLTFVDPALPELLLKALDFGDRTLLYWGALTDLGYRLTVDDLRTGVSRSYTNAPRQRCGGSDSWAPP